MVEVSKIPIITISREYYAGGRSVARYLSEKLDIPWYDKDFVKLASEISGYSEEEIDSEGEEIGMMEKLMESLLSGLNQDTSSHDAIHEAEKEAVLELAKTPCIIVGRLANDILRNASIPSINILLYADKETRVQRYMDKQGKSMQEAQKYVEQRDKFRGLYYEKYTGKSFSDSHNYTVCFDTGLMDYKQCADAIIRIIESLYA